MRVGFSDVVLDCQPTRRRALPSFAKSGMIELELALSPRRPRMNASTAERSSGSRRVGLRAGDRFFRMRSREPIERLMQLHDQTMQAVAAGLGKSG